MDATALLSTPLSRAASVMGADARAVRRTFKSLAAQWHPDRCGDPQAAAVFAHVVALRDAALGPASAPASGPSRVFVFQDGRRVGARPLSSWQTDSGETLVGRRSVSFVFAPGCADLAAQARARWAGVRFADARMQAAFAPLAPAQVAGMEGVLEGGGEVLVVRRRAGFVALPDLIHHQGGRLDPVHVAWLGSGLLNLAAWFGWMGMAHGAISPQAVFVHPATHEVCVWGGWEFATPLGTRPSALPDATLRAIPRLEAAGEVVDAATDLWLVRDVLRYALGEPFQMRPKGADVPEAMARAIARPPADSAIKEYAAWIAALEEAWGPRRFRVLDVGEADIYP